MNFKLFFYIITVIIVLSSCSKTDEMAEPTTTPVQYTMVTYTHTVSDAHANLVYGLEYMTAKGIVKVPNIKGNFTKRVPAMRYDSAGNNYVRTMFSFHVHKPAKGDAPLLNSGIKITTDYGFVIAKTNIDAHGCGNTEREVSEVTPLSWFYVR